MITIAICDDNRQELSQISDIIEQYRTIHQDLDFGVNRFSSPSELLQHAETNGPCNLYLLDILMPEMDGIRLSKQIRTLDQQCIIIFLTASRDFALDAYGVYAFQYLIKPISSSQLHAVLDLAINQIKVQRSRSIPVKTKEGIVSIFNHTIISVEYRSHVLYFNLSDGQCINSIHIRTTFEESIASLMEDHRFIHPHKSYVSNMEQVKKLTENAFVMNDNSIVPIARKNYQETKSRYLKFLAQRGTNPTNTP